MRLSGRQREILRLARETGQVTVDALAERFAVSAQTIRRDLGELCDGELLTRTHGGALARPADENIGYAARAAIAAPGKAAIGRLCAAEIPDGASLFINIGTTTEAVARALVDRPGLMVVTNNLNVANIMAANERAEVIVAGGVLRRADAGLIGEATAEFIARFKVDFAIIGASAIDADGALLDYDYREVRVSQAIIENARRVLLVADATKFERNAPVRIAPISAVDAFFTDLPPPESVVRACRENRVELRVAASVPA